jgi:hypothetical protein
VPARFLLERIARSQSTRKNRGQDSHAPTAASGMKSQTSEYRKFLEPVIVQLSDFTRQFMLELGRLERVFNSEQPIEAP